MTMSPLNRGPLLGPRAPPSGGRLPPLARFGGRLPPPGMPPRMPPPLIGGMFGPMRQRIPPPLRPGAMLRPGGPMPPFALRGGRGIPPLVPPIASIRGVPPRGPPGRPWPRAALPPQGLPHMRPRFPIGNGNVKGKMSNNAKQANKLEELELKKPWMTDEIRSEIQKKNKLYAKAKKNKDAKEWEEFKDLRNKVTRMIRDAKNEYLAKHPEQAHLYADDGPYDEREENCMSSDEDRSYYCEVCDKEFDSDEGLAEHKATHRLCGIDGCSFSAHPMLVEKHIKMQHSSGLFHRMKNLSSPEDVEKWIRERKRKYPTAANKQLKSAQELEKINRGEIVKENHSVPRAKSNRTLNVREKKRKARKQRHKPVNTIEVVFYNNEIYRGVRAFPGLTCLTQLDEENVNDDVGEELDEKIVISDDEDVAQLPNNSTTTESRLVNLVPNYSDSEQDEGPEEVPIKKVILESNNSADGSISVNENVVSEVKTIQPNVNKENLDKKLPRERNEERSSKRKQTKQKKCVNTSNVNRLQLLNKLLSRSIQHERNLICQCLKFIVDNNYFD